VEGIHSTHISMDLAEGRTREKVNVIENMLSLIPTFV